MLYDKVLFEQTNIQLYNKGHLVEKKRDCLICLKNAVIFLVA